MMIRDIAGQSCRRTLHKPAAGPSDMNKHHTTKNLHFQAFHGTFKQQPAWVALVSIYAAQSATSAWTLCCGFFCSLFCFSGWMEFSSSPERATLKVSGLLSVRQHSILSQLELRALSHESPPCSPRQKKLAPYSADLGAFVTLPGAADAAPPPPRSPGSSASEFRYWSTRLCW